MKAPTWFEWNSLFPARSMAGASISAKASTAGNSAQLHNHPALNYWLQSLHFESNPTLLT